MKISEAKFENSPLYSFLRQDVDYGQRQTAKLHMFHKETTYTRKAQGRDIDN